MWIWLLAVALVLITAAVVLLWVQRRALDATRVALHAAGTQLENQRGAIAALEVEVANLRQARIHLRARNKLLLETLLEPARDGRCDKVRLRDVDEARAFAAYVQEQVPECGEMAPYQCKICPRHPVTLNWHYHVGHVDPALRNRKYNPVAARPSPGRIARRITPADIAKLKKRVTQGDS